jgi:rubrerythrin
MFSIRDIIDIAIRIEQNGERIYRAAAKMISDPDLMLLMQWLADEEADHIKWFENLKLQNSHVIDDQALEQMGKDILLDIVGEQSFSLDDVDLSESMAINELVTVAIEYEKDTVMFYEMLRPFVEDFLDVQQLDKIIAEENSHVEKLQAIGDTGIPSEP